VQLDTSERLAALLPAGSLRVSESGIFTHEHCARLARHGYRAFLVGEALVTDPDPAARLRALKGEGAAH
jgi:indole-3-glycerol phosphate synthase